MQQTIQPLSAMQSKLVSKWRYIVACISTRGVMTAGATAHSKHVMTHSYTIKKTVTSVNGRLLSLLFVVLQEFIGDFGPNVRHTKLNTNNLNI